MAEILANIPENRAKSSSTNTCTELSTQESPICTQAFADSLQHAIETCVETRREETHPQSNTHSPDDLSLDMCDVATEEATKALIAMRQSNSKPYKADRTEKNEQTPDNSNTNPQNDGKLAYHAFPWDTENAIDVEENTMKYENEHAEDITCQNPKEADASLPLDASHQHVPALQRNHTKHHLIKKIPHVEGTSKALPKSAAEILMKGSGGEDPVNMSTRSDVSLKNVYVSPDGGITNYGRWTEREHSAFVEGLRKYGRDWKKIGALIKTRTGVQIRTHAQKYFMKLREANSSEVALNGEDLAENLVYDSNNRKKSGRRAETAKLILKNTISKSDIGL